MLHVLVRMGMFAQTHCFTPPEANPACDCLGCVSTIKQVVCMVGAEDQSVKQQLACRQQAGVQAVVHMLNIA